jgi:hypothetical protein
MNNIDSAEEALAQNEVIEAINRGIMSFTEGRVKYQLHNERSYGCVPPQLEMERALFR